MYYVLVYLCNDALVSLVLLEILFCFLPRDSYAKRGICRRRRRRRRVCVCVCVVTEFLLTSASRGPSAIAEPLV